MGIAKKVSELSYEGKVKVGCVIVRDGNILSFSYNGTAIGTDNTMRDSEGKTLPEVLHAETNAIGKIARSHESSRDATLYSTLSPCMECAKTIYQSGIKRVVFKDLYRISPVAWLAANGVEIEKV